MKNLGQLESQTIHINTSEQKAKNWDLWDPYIQDIYLCTIFIMLSLLMSYTKIRRSYNHFFMNIESLTYLCILMLKLKMMKFAHTVFLISV